MLNKKSKFTAILLAILLPGAGHWYIEDVVRGWLLFIVAVVGAVFTMGIVGVAVWLYSIIDLRKRYEIKFE